MSITWWWYPKRRFQAEGREYALVTRCRNDRLVSQLVLDGAIVAEDHTPIIGKGATRNHGLTASLPDGRTLAVEMGYVGMGWTIGIIARIDGAIVHESHPGKAIGYPQVMRGTAEATELGAFAPRNRVPVLVDIATGLLFFAVAKATDLTTAALVGAAVGVGLLLFQRLTRIDVTGGLALFGIAMLLISAGIALIAEDEVWVQLRSTIVGLIAAGLFFGDALVFKGRKLAAALARYMPYGDLDLRRLGIGMGAAGAATALLNAAVTRLASKDFWLTYTTFLDIPVTMALLIAMLHWARQGSQAR